jgi:hypothetical protein
VAQLVDHMCHVEGLQGGKRTDRMDHEIVNSEIVLAEACPVPGPDLALEEVLLKACCQDLDPSPKKKTGMWKGLLKKIKRQDLKKSFLNQTIVLKQMFYHFRMDQAMSSKMIH